MSFARWAALGAGMLTAAVLPAAAQAPQAQPAPPVKAPAAAPPPTKAPAAKEAAPKTDDMFAAYIASDVYKASLEQAFNLGEPAALKAQCPALKVVEANRVQVIEPVKFAKAGEGFSVASGQWVAIALLDRCGTKVKRRAVFIVQPATGQIEPVFLLPGEFRGNLKLERDARAIVLPGLAGVAKCQDPAKLAVLDVVPLTKADPAGWSETWIADTCGKTVEATVTYAGTPTGMTVTASNLRVK